MSGNSNSLSLELPKEIDYESLDKLSGSQKLDVLIQITVDIIESLTVIPQSIEQLTVNINYNIDKYNITSNSQKTNEKIDITRNKLSIHLKLKKLCEYRDVLDEYDIPTDLLHHIDHELSPNLWLNSLVKEVQYLNDVVRGELIAINRSYRALSYYNDFLLFVRHKTNKKYSVQIPDYTVLSRSATKYRQPVILDTIRPRLDIVGILKTLNTDITPYEIDELQSMLQ